MKKDSEKNLSTYIRRDDLDGLEIFTGSFDSHSFKPHFHESYTIIFVLEGTGDYSTKNKQLVVPSGSSLVLKPYEVHTGKPTSGEGWRFLSAYIPQSLVESAYQNYKGNDGSEGLNQPVFREHRLDCPQLFQIGTQTFTAILEGNNSSLAKQQIEQFLKVLFHVGDKINEPEHQRVIRESVNLVKDYLHLHYAKEISIEHLCNLSGLTEFSLIKSFKKYFELPPHQYLINLRVEKAKKLLKQTSSSTHIAYEVGFYDQSHFIRHFKNIVGITPKKFKDQKINSTFAYK